MPAIERVAVIGGGIIGASWTAPFAAAGSSVGVHDPAEGAEDSVRAYVARAWPTLRELGLARTSAPQGIRFWASLEESVDGAGFVQECVPERLDLKHQIFRRIEPLLTPDAIVASSASGLMVREMQEGWRDPARFLLGHPFNPPHLIPLVELLGNERTDPEAISDAESF